MIFRFLSLDSFFTKNKVFKSFMNFFSIMQIFYPLQPMAYTENLGLHGFFADPVTYMHLCNAVLYLDTVL